MAALPEKRRVYADSMAGVGSHRQHLVQSQHSPDFAADFPAARRGQPPAEVYEYARRISEHSGDRYGWVEGANDTWHYTMFIQNGRILDTPDDLLMTGLREIANVHDGDFRLTANQNLLIGQVSSKRKPVIDVLLKKYRLDNHRQTGLRLNSMACVALPTCGLAMAGKDFHS